MDGVLGIISIGAGPPLGETGTRGTVLKPGAGVDACGG